MSPRCRNLEGTHNARPSLKPAWISEKVNGIPHFVFLPQLHLWVHISFTFFLFINSNGRGKLSPILSFLALFFETGLY
jgi:hypothetical protein